MSRHSQDQFYQSLSIKAGLSEKLVELLNFSRSQSQTLGKSEISLAWGEAWMMTHALKALYPTKILEVGTLTGFSALFLTHALAPEGGEVWTIEKDETHWQKSCEVFKKWGEESEISPSHRVYHSEKNKIHSLLGDGVETLRFMRAPWDGIFIDANKSATTEYAHMAYQLLKIGGALIVDNSFGRGALWDPTVHAKAHRILNELATLLTSEKFESCLWPTSDGMWWAVKK